MTLFKRLGRAVTVSGAALAALGVYSLGVEPRWLRVTRMTLPIIDLPPAFDGMRIVHLSDIHLGIPSLDRRLPLIVAATNREMPDLIVITGDIATGHHAGLDAGMAVLKGLRARLGVWAVLGNHDYSVGDDHVAAVVESAGIRVLRNAHHVLICGADRLVLAGVDDAVRGIADLNGALDGTLPTDRIVLLAHEPDYARFVVADARVALQLSGHTHGGQIRFPLLPPLYLPHLGHLYPHGCYWIEDRLWLVVSAGIGTGQFVVRFNCRPELGVITLTRSRSDFRIQGPESARSDR